MRRALAAIALCGVAALSCSDDGTSTAPSTDAAEASDMDSVGPYDGYVTEVDGYVTEVYDDPAVWLCWPGNDDVCARDLDATIVNADGTIEVEPFERASAAPIDCFYLYPTISSDPTANSDLVPAEIEEIYTTWAQAARYQSVCDVYAPVYRQNTLTSMFDRVDPPEGVDTGEVAYADVLDAFSHYLATANKGRGFVLLGHSQGAGMIRRLIAEEIDGAEALQEQFIAAHILGASVSADVADTFSTIPACTAVDQVGCVVSYASYEAGTELTEDDFFGISEDAPALCTNPASLDGARAVTQPYFLFSEPRGLLGGSLGPPFTDPDTAPEITTLWITYPDLVTAECVDDGLHGYLSIGVLADPADPRTDDIGGRFNPGWGLHLVDANVVMGDLVDMVAAQAAAYLG